jgi:hypothetical protein
VRDAGVQANQRHVDALRRRDEARQAAGSPAEIATLLADGVRSVLARLPATVELIVNDAIDVETVTQVASAIGRVTDALDTVKRDRQTLGKHPDDPSRLAQDAEAAAAAAEQAAKESSEQAPALVQLASSAIGLLGERCPVCNQPIDEDVCPVAPSRGARPIAEPGRPRSRVAGRARPCTGRTRSRSGRVGRPPDRCRETRRVADGAKWCPPEVPWG